jgi:hypothetical protein
MANTADQPHLHWRKSSRSNITDQCVEVCTSRVAVLMRDSKDRPRGHLAFSPSSWADFLHGVRRGEFDLRSSLR